jgi:alkanesulfonate monooxygenase SsuD/methylene tetrahydromethanopterin reductase-like flavin-dependent oxidoreductase (luciferase family)
LDIGVGFNPQIPVETQMDLAREAARLGFDLVTTAEGPGQTYFHDAFQMCLMRWIASKEVREGGITTMIAVSPVALRTPVGLAMSAQTLNQITGGKFILGVGTGRAYSGWYRKMWGVRDKSTVGLMRDYISTIKALMTKEGATVESPHFKYSGAKLNIDYPAPPIWVAALGPNIIQVGAELTDGLVLNNCSPEYIRDAVRPMVAQHAKAAGRDPSEVKIQHGVRLVIDDDIKAARRVLARGQIGEVSLSPTRTRGEAYQRHDAQQGYTEELAEVQAMIERGMSEDDILDHYPEALLKGAYYGPMDGAIEAFKRISAPLDVAMLNVSTAGKTSIEQTKAFWRALRPEVLKG